MPFKIVSGRTITGNCGAVITGNTYAFNTTNSGFTLMAVRPESADRIEKDLGHVDGQVLKRLDLKGVTLFIKSRIAY